MSLSAEELQARQEALAAEKAALDARAAEIQAQAEALEVDKIENMSDAQLAQYPPEAQKEIRSLRHEAMTNRKNLVAEKQRAAALEQAINDRKRQDELAELESKKNYSEAIAKQGQHYEGEIKKTQVQFLDAKIEAAAARAGIPDDMTVLIPRNGITIDASGNVNGIAEAIATCKTKYAHILNAGSVQRQTTEPVQVAGAPAAANPNAQPGAGGQSFNQMQQQFSNAGNAGSAPPPAGQKPKTAFDARTAKPEDRAKRLAEIKKAQGQK